MSSGTTSKNRFLDRLGLRFQLAIFFLVAFGGLFVTFAAGMYWHVAGVYRTEFDTALYNYVVDISHTFSSQSMSGRLPADNSLTFSEMIVPFSPLETLLQVVDESGQVVSRSRSLGLRSLPVPKEGPNWLEQRAIFADVMLPKSPEGDEAGLGAYRIVSHGFFREDGARYLIQAAVPLTLLDRQREGLLVFLSVAVPVTLLLAALAGLMFSRRAMAPVAAITAKANEIEAQHLSERIPLPQSRDEVRELAGTLNNLLDRLETAFRTQEAFIADASHQLKTPLSILKGELEVFSQAKRSPEELTQFLGSAKQEIDYLVQMVEDLLLLARVDSGWDQRAMQRFRLDEKLMECVARVSRYAGDRKSSITVDVLPDIDELGGAFELEADPELIRALIENLLDNSLKYSPSGTVVVVSLEESQRAYVLKVTDSGPGIPPEAMPHIFDRFFRGDPLKHSVPGSGLGLSIVRRIAEIHGGNVSAENRPEGGALFRVEIPRG